MKKREREREREREKINIRRCVSRLNASHKAGRISWRPPAPPALRRKLYGGKKRKTKRDRY